MVTSQLISMKCQTKWNILQRLYTFKSCVRQMNTYWENIGRYIYWGNAGKDITYKGRPNEMRLFCRFDKWFNNISVLKVVDIIKSDT